MQSRQTQSRHIEISLDLQLDEGLLSGRATDGDGATKSFAGWLGLVDAIDSLVEAEDSVPAAHSSNGVKEES
jgi:hypothetical protein